jgi:hypothetical protein
MFESTNFFMHGARMIEALEGPKALVLAFDFVFAVSFLLFRPIGGTWYWLQFLNTAIQTHRDGYNVHNAAAMWTVVAGSGSLLALQWVWAGTVCRGVGSTLGLCAPPIGDPKMEAKKAKKAAAAAAAAAMNKKDQ